MRILSYFSLILGLFLFIFSLTLLLQRYSPTRLNFYGKVPSTHIKKNTNNTPILLKIPELDIELPVIPAEIKKNKWGTTTIGVSWLIASSIPGEKGNSIFYGHNWNRLLGNLENVKTGYTVEILYKNSVKRYFKIKNIEIVNPDQVEVLNNTQQPRLTVYTCTGFMDQKRLVVTAEYKPKIKNKLATSL